MLASSVPEFGCRRLGGAHARAQAHDEHAASTQGVEFLGAGPET